MKISELALSDSELLHNEWQGRDIHDHQIGLLKFSIHRYGPFYDYIFADLEEAPVSLMEIGISGGWSLLCWDKYLKNSKSKIVGIDPLPQMLAKIENPEQVRGKYEAEKYKTILRNQMLVDVSQKYSDRVFLCYENAYTQETLDGFPDCSFDVIIDDGSHKPEDKQYVLNHYWSKVRSGGWLVIEDYWSDKDAKVLEVSLTLPEVYERIVYDGDAKKNQFFSGPTPQEGLIALRKQ